TRMMNPDAGEQYVEEVAKLGEAAFGPREMKRFMEQFMTWDADADAMSVSTQTLLIHQRNSKAFSTDKTRRVAGLIPSQRHWIPLTTEGGHATFAPTDQRERQLLDYFTARYGRVSIERLLCGQGLLDLYLAHAALLNVTASYNTPAEVTGAARAGDRVAREALLRFIRILGACAGDAALTLGALGGVYLCGGITPRLIEWLPRSDFRRAFADKGRLSAYNAGIPTWVVTAPWTGLLGAAEALHNEEVT
ncbi:MAG: glucokinase, partial [Salinicola sp.]|uniref:glucokinase n=1 Tax=Salinicola sp. TaxID=1978524 RepID=UPI001D2E98BC